MSNLLAIALVATTTLTPTNPACRDPVIASQLCDHAYVLYERNLRLEDELMSTKVEIVHLGEQLLAATSTVAPVIVEKHVETTPGWIYILSIAIGLGAFGLGIAL